MDETPKTNAVITDHRQAPRGVLPRSAQMWLMVAIAVVMLGIIFIAGRPQTPNDPRPATTLQPPPNPDRVKEYQERLRVLDERATREAQEAASSASTPQPTYQDAQPAPPEDPLAADRRRRNYESLFASNVVLSRRPDDEKPTAVRADLPNRSTPPTNNAAPSIDEIADAVVRATTRAGAALSSSTGGLASQSQAGGPAVAPAPAPAPARAGEPRTATQPVHRLMEGTVLDTVLTNRLDGGVAAPVNCLVTNPIYSMDRRHVLIPAGAKVLGDTKPVQGFGETRLAVAFHRPGHAGRHDVSAGRFHRCQSNRRRWSTRPSEPPLLVYVRGRWRGRSD
jgi:type IV secretion system protein VirB10